MWPCVSRIFSGITLSFSIASRMRGASPPGSTIAARLVAVHATIEQFCANGVTGTMVTFRGCMQALGGEGGPSYSETVLRRESLERGFGPRAEMLDHFGRRDCAEACAIAVVLIARKNGEKTCREEIARAGRIDKLVDRRRRYRVVAFPRDDDATFFAARHGGKLHLVAQRRHGAIEVGGLVETLQFGLVGEDQIDRAGSHQGAKVVAIAVDAKRV